MVHPFQYSNVIPMIFIFCVCEFFVQCSNLSIDGQTSNIDHKNSSTLISCSSLDLNKLRLVTFDLFGALMLTESSMNQNIASLLPSLSSLDVEKFTSNWLSAYVSYFGKSFPSSLTHQPFLWIIRSSLLKILDSFDLTSMVPEHSDTFNSLMSVWGNLKPRSGATEVLTKLSRKYQLGLLSNGDKGTLQAALRIFPSSVNVSLTLSSNYPVNCFKPCSQMYAQALAAVDGDKNQVLHVAGSAFDAHGARSFGIFSGALDSSAMQTNPKPCFAFNDITELISFFKV
ncbi:unnamed protein product [Rotaria magnacalcarata]|uniref:Uncharacterized protein n=1 Tax=Rotaria magnacalcarata TaxID=392030 RepID=A0A816T1F3_9BILA|nr:unnamed protein product [Rotaria magnacalcarata]CAF4245065.1 unnamed protein product [Rotaria magnacalcarata]